MSHTKSPLMLILLLGLLSVLLLGPDTVRATPANPPSLRTFGRIRNQSAAEKGTGAGWASDVVEKSVPSAHIHASRSVAKASLPLPLKPRLVPFLSTSTSVTTAAMDQLLREEMAELDESDFRSRQESGSKKVRKSRLGKNH
ncbi:hypothetical protein [Phaffia rhodozyma]|uniref:Uncharacterized protein n=1 Tax=Phaffia rhodozyma TaxID=264483 RepID=A0A0F7SKM4_PHARH|nr:hypothetical protein [Phaffia rhodozyma]